MQKVSAALFGGAFVLLFAGPAGAQDLITNGSFETGSLSGWTATANTSSGCDTDWKVGSSGSATGCSNPGNPIYGSYAAYNSFDGNGPQNFTLRQSFTVPVGVSSASLIFSDALYWSYSSRTSPPQSRVFTVSLLDALSNTLATPYSLKLAHGTGSQPWTTHTFDVSSVLAAHGGENLQLQFNAYIPEYFTGPAGMGLDNVQLNVTVTDPAPTVTPEPVSMALLGTGLAGLGAVRRRRRTARE